MDSGEKRQRRASLIIWENQALVREVISKGQYDFPFGLDATTQTFLNPIKSQWGNPCFSGEFRLAHDEFLPDFSDRIVFQPTLQFHSNNEDSLALFSFSLLRSIHQWPPCQIARLYRSEWKGSCPLWIICRLLFDAILDTSPFLWLSWSVPKWILLSSHWLLNSVECGRKEQRISFRGDPSRFKKAHKWNNGFRILSTNCYKFLYMVKYSWIFKIWYILY